MAQHRAERPVDADIELLPPENIQKGPDHGPQAVPDAEDVVAVADGEAVVPAHGQHGDPGGPLGLPGRAVAGGVAGGQPADFVHRGLAPAHPAEIGPRPSRAEPIRAPPIWSSGQRRKAVELQQWTMPVSTPAAVRAERTFLKVSAWAKTEFSLQKAEWKWV